MDQPYYGLPCLTELETFEVLGRRRSFELTASEVNIAPEVVSRRVNAVEEQLGVALIASSGSGVRLTEPGEDLHRALAETFTRASDVFRRLKRKQSLLHLPHK
ncbi:LysR family transcriptional regulator [Mesorhizobium sp. M0051]|uniref:LysR family transcriptional regulator n=1 Tax=Mesorhizobium sp. M0051 TaxID=2956862 RepID=UPI00333B8037